MSYVTLAGVRHHYYVVSFDDGVLCLLWWFSLFPVLPGCWCCWVSWKDWMKSPKSRIMMPFGRSQAKSFTSSRHKVTTHTHTRIHANTHQKDAFIQWEGSSPSHRGGLGQNVRSGNLTLIQAIPYTNNKFWNMDNPISLFVWPSHKKV